MRNTLVFPEHQDQMQEGLKTVWKNISSYLYNDNKEV